MSYKKLRIVLCSSNCEKDILMWSGNVVEDMECLTGCQHLSDYNAARMQHYFGLNIWKTGMIVQDVC